MKAQTEVLAVDQADSLNCGGEAVQLVHTLIPVIHLILIAVLRKGLGIVELTTLPVKLLLALIIQLATT